MCRKKPDFYSAGFVTSKQPTPLQLNVSIGRPFEDVFTMKTFRAVKHRLIQVWCSLDWDIIDTAIDHWFKRLPVVFLHTMLISSTPCELTQR